LANADRFTLRGMLAVDGVAYFDNLAVRALTEPHLARFGNMSFASVSISDAPNT
jgi:hypothetical protein